MILYTVGAGGVCLSACWDTNPQTGTPWTRHPPDQAPPKTRHPWTRHPPRQGTPQCRACWEIQSMHGWYTSYWNAILLFIFLPPTNEVWDKVICLQVCVCPQGGVWSWGVPHPQVVPGPRGVSGPRGGAWSRRVPGPRGVWSWGVPGGDTPGRLLLRAVRILLECILVYIYVLHVCDSYIKTITYQNVSCF